MYDFEYLVTYFDKFITKFGNNLNIQQCELRISDYTFKSPQALSHAIQMPLKYLHLLNLNSILILRNQNIFKTLGKSENEKFTQADFRIKDYTLTLDDFLVINKLNESIYSEKPIDERRRSIATMLDVFMNSFILYHELGHVRQLNFNTASEEVNIEFEEKNSTTARWKEQAMEIDADVFALNFLWGDVFYNVNSFKPNETFRTVHEMLLVAAYSIFLFFYLSNVSEEINNPTKVHPHPIVRFSILANFLQDLCLKNELFATIEEFKSFIQKVLREFDNTLIYHFNVPKSNLYYDRFFDPAVKEVMKTLREHIQKDPSLNFNRPYSLS